MCAAASKLWPNTVRSPIEHKFLRFGVICPAGSSRPDFRHPRKRGDRDSKGAGYHLALNNYQFVSVKKILTAFLASVFLGGAAVRAQAPAGGADRVEALLGRMTLEEKIGQMCQYVGIETLKANTKSRKKVLLNDDATGMYPALKFGDIEEMTRTGRIGSFLHVFTAGEANRLQGLARESRLQIPLLIGIDAIHGDGMVPGATVYPAPLGLAATFDDALVERTAAESAVEIRANGAQWTFAPNIEVARDARWGRVGETFGEDPLLVGRLGVATVRGLQQGNAGAANQVLACIKHAIAGSEPINGLNGAPADISEHTLRSIFLPPFFEAIRNGAGSLMMAHNELNGVPCHANAWLMEEVFRREGGFDGFIVSDWMDIERMVAVHHTAADQKEAVYQAVMAGMDLHMHGPGFFEPLRELVREGRIPETRIDASVRRILRAKARLGLFEQGDVPPERTQRETFTAAHQETALRAARESLVLLKNEGGLLPLEGGRFRRILVTGPLADSAAILGDWAGAQPADHVITALQGVRAAAPAGCQIVWFDCGESVKSTPAETIAKAAQAAGGADAVVLVVGDNALRYAAGRTSGENEDRSDIELPGDQLALVKAVAGEGKPVVVVLVGGRPLGSEWTVAHAAAVLEAFEPGCQGGRAIGEVLFGRVNPSGKLPITVPRSAGQIQVVYNHVPSYYLHTFAIGSSEPLYWFGHGLSYTQFRYEHLRVPAEAHPHGPIPVRVEVTNTGSRAGDEVVLVYVRELVSSTTTPERALKAYQRVSLAPGEQKTVSLALGWDDLSLVDAHLNRVVEPGEFEVFVGDQSARFEVKNP